MHVDISHAWFLNGELFSKQTVLVSHSAQVENIGIWLNKIIASKASQIWWSHPRVTSGQNPVTSRGEPYAAPRARTPPVRHQSTTVPHSLVPCMGRFSTFCASAARGAPHWQHDGDAAVTHGRTPVERSAHKAPSEGRPSHVVCAEQVGRGGPAATSVTNLLGTQRQPGTGLLVCAFTTELF